MLILRKIAKLLRGDATPMQIMFACVLGSLIGFMPGFAQAPGLTIVLIMLLVVLNANLFLAASAAAIAKLVSLAIMPLTFTVGRVLLDGPTSGLFAMLINAPVTALMGFEYYATTGGLVTGVIFGVLAGMLVIRSLAAFRNKMASLQEGSDRYKQWTSKGYVKVLSFIFIGGGKKDYRNLMTRRMGKPVRTIGVIAVALFGLLLGIAYQFASGPIVAAAMQRGLERSNGATVNIADAEIDLVEGRLVLLGFAMADPNDLATDLLRADRLEADISGRDLLRKRIALDHARFTNASTGEKRAIPGRRVGRWPQPQPVPDKTPEENTIEDYIAEAQEWKDRLAQIRQWLDRMSGPEEATEDDPDARRETLRERLNRQVAELGYARVRAEHLIDGAPTFMVYHLDAEQVRTAQLPGATLDIRGRNLSTHPHLGQEPPSLLIESSDERLRAFVSLDHAVSDAASKLDFHITGIQVDSVAGRLSAKGVINGGTMDLRASGTYGGQRAGWIDLPLNVTMHNTEMTLGGTSRTISQIMVPLGLRGPMDNPAIMLDDRQFAEALMQAGASELARQVDERVGGRIDEALDKAGDRLPSKIGDTIRDGAGSLLPGRQRN